MIEKKHRFHGYGSLKFVYAQGRTVRSNQLAVRYAPNPKRQDYRTAVVVSKKVSKSAVVRNRIRRRLYELVRLSNITVPVDVVITVHSEQVADMPAPELQKILTKLLRQADMLK